MIKKRDEAFGPAKAEGLQGDELWKQVQDSARLTDEQTEAFRITWERHRKYSASAIGLLSSEQKVAFRKTKIAPSNQVQFSKSKPNILWITIEDWGPDLSCYGTPGIETPHVDKLAAEGIRYQWAFTTSPVCSTSRSAMMTGYHQNFIGANQHREHDKQPLPFGIKPIPHLLKEAGYFTALMSWKTDCNFVPNTKAELFEGTDWNQRAEGQPFFACITFGGTHRKWNRDPQRPIDPKDVEIPPYYADTPLIRRDWATGLEQMQIVDREVGALLNRLEDEGLAENTLVFFIGDHGRCHIRGKQFLYDGGIRIPMIMRWPGKVKPRQVDTGLVMSLDICATIMAVAGVNQAVPSHGKSLFDPELRQRKFVFAARDKMDETHDAMRAVRSRNHKLIVNLMPERPWCQYNKYKEGAYPALAEMNVLHMTGKLNEAQSRFFAASKPEIELFDLKADPHEINNVADDPEYELIKAELLTALITWRQIVIRDKGVSDEFRAKDTFPAANTHETVDNWFEANRNNYDFAVTGWPAWYPTRTLEQWRAAKQKWEPWVFRSVDDPMERPVIVTPNKKKKK
ncbi:MAG: sulfatase [Planctomycetota bacterium]